jgi:hypothetical protein
VSKCAITSLAGENFTNTLKLLAFLLVAVSSSKNRDMLMGRFDGHQTGFSTTPSLEAPTKNV